LRRHTHSYGFFAQEGPLVMAFPASSDGKRHFNFRARRRWCG
jgi:hypothetical protein